MIAVLFAFLAAVCALLNAVCVAPSHTSQIPLASPSASITASPVVTVQPKASRSRTTSTAPATTSQVLDVTAYCWTGHRTASGVWPALGMAAGNRWPFGTRLHIAGYGDVTITDRIGAYSDLDIYLGRDGCQARAIQFGRRHLAVSVIPSYRPDLPID